MDRSVARFHSQSITYSLRCFNAGKRESHDRSWPCADTRGPPSARHTVTPHIPTLPAPVWPRGVPRDGSAEKENVCHEEQASQDEQVGDQGRQEKTVGGEWGSWLAGGLNSGPAAQLEVTWTGRDPTTGPPSAHVRPTMHWQAGSKDRRGAELSSSVLRGRRRAAAGAACSEQHVLRRNGWPPQNTCSPNAELPVFYQHVVPADAGTRKCRNGHELYEVQKRDHGRASRPRIAATKPYPVAAHSFGARPRKPRGQIEKT